jgi:hypothetical protein
MESLSPSFFYYYVIECICIYIYIDNQALGTLQDTLGVHLQ